jgi:UDP-N-acetylmuramate--alanine ligase
LVGIAGSGMSALASLLLDLGWRITGCDQRPHGVACDGLRERGVHIHEGHDARFLPRRLHLLIHSAAIPETNVERVAARLRGVPEVSYSGMLGRLMRDRIGIGIAGTHGKSTTAAMTAAILSEAGLNPSACIGAVPRGATPGEPGRGGWAAGELFVVEACEYRGAFLELSPSYAAILAVEPDHFDCFADFDENRQAFRDFAARVRPRGLLVVSADCPAALEAAEASAARIETFSLRTRADWLAEDVRSDQGGVRFRVRHRGDAFADVALSFPGRHQAHNALAAIAIGHALGVSASDAAAALARFAGVRRRFERLGTWRGVTWIDDYAHHPTAIRATLEAVRDGYPDRRVWCVFEPHQLSRTRALLAEFSRSFRRADRVLIAPVFAAREAGGAEANALARRLAERIGVKGTACRFVDLDRIAATLDDETRAGDVVVTMGAGSVHQVHHEFTRRLPSHRAG